MHPRLPDDLEAVRFLRTALLMVAWFDHLDATQKYLLALVLLAVLVRLVWMASFVVRSWRQADDPAERAEHEHERQTHRGRLIKDSRLPKNLRENPELLEGRYDLFKTQLTVAYSLGGLAFAALTFLLSAGPGNSVYDSFTVGILEAAVLTALAAPQLFRFAGGELTRMGYETCLALSGFLLAVAVLSVVQKTLPGSGGAALTVIIPTAFALRDVLEVRTQFGLTRELFEPRPAGLVQGATRSAGGDTVPS